MKLEWAVKPQWIIERGPDRMPRRLVWFGGAVLLKRCDGTEVTPGTWRGVTSDGRRTAYAMCPNGHIAGLHEHEIDEKGRVSPSVVCPEDGCEFHEYVQLEGWEAP